MASTAARRREVISESVISESVFRRLRAPACSLITDLLITDLLITDLLITDLLITDLLASRNSCTAMTNQSEASTALNSGCPPWSGNRFGSIPSDTVADQAIRMSRATPRRPVARQRPRKAMKVSRPQSLNHG